MDFKWISGFHMDFRISGLISVTVYEISRVSDPSANTRTPVLENARKTYLDAGEGRGRIHFLIALVQLCAQKQRNKRCDVFLELCLLLASIGKIHSKERPRRPFCGHT